MHVAEGDWLNVKSPGATELHTASRQAWQAGSRQADWLVDWHQAVWSALKQWGWKPSLKRSRVQIHGMF